MCVCVCVCVCVCGFGEFPILGSDAKASFGEKLPYPCNAFSPNQSPFTRERRNIGSPPGRSSRVTVTWEIQTQQAYIINDIINELYIIIHYIDCTDYADMTDANGAIPSLCDIK